MKIKMFLRNVAKTFSRSELRFLLRNSYFGSNQCRSNSLRQFTTSSLALSEEKVKVTFTLHNGEKITSEGKVGDSLLDVIQDNNLNIEGFGACEGTLTCSTCHVILKKEDYDRLPDQPCDEERDMLDLAYGLTDTSRLGCQICLKKDLEGLEVIVPETINDARS